MGSNKIYTIIVCMLVLLNVSVNAFCWGTVSSSGYCTGLGTGPNDPRGSNSRGFAVNQMWGQRRLSESRSHDWDSFRTIGGKKVW
jgi:hypothetical protein